jgi:hypothetical protein
MESSWRMRPPSVLAVFRMFCLDGMSASAIARRARCGKTTVLRRLELIRRRTGIVPARFRRISSHFESAAEQLEDSRASRIRPRSLLEDEEGEE